MDISAILKAVLAPGHEGAQARLAELRPGDQLSAKVLRVEADGRLLIDMAGKLGGKIRALTQIDIPAKPGQVLQLTVDKVGTPLQLRLTPMVPPTAAKPLPEIGLASLFTSNEQQQALNAIQRLVKLLPEQRLDGKLPVSQLKSDTGQAHQTTRLQNEMMQKPASQVQSEIGQKTTIPLQGQVGQKPVLQTKGDAGQEVSFQVQNEIGQKQAAQLPSETWTKSSKTQTSTPSGTMQIPPSSSGMGTVVRAEAPVQQALLQLGLFMVKPSVDASVRQWADALQTQLSDSGHLFEAKLAEMVASSSPSGGPASGEALRRAVSRDLKPNLLILKEALAESGAQAMAETGANTKDINRLRQTVDRLLSHVELQQERAVQRAGDQESYQVFAHLLPVKEHPQPVRIKVYYPRKKAGGEGNPQHRIALLLDMDRLGPVRADVAMAGRLLSIRFFVKDQAIQERFEQHVGEVESVLSESFGQVDIATFVSEEKIAQFEHEDREASSVGRIDLRA